LDHDSLKLHSLSLIIRLRVMLSDVKPVNLQPVTSQKYVTSNSDMMECQEYR